MKHKLFAKNLYKYEQEKEENKENQIPLSYNELIQVTVDDDKDDYGDDDEEEEKGRGGGGRRGDYRGIQFMRRMESVKRSGYLCLLMRRLIMMTMIDEDEKVQRLQKIMKENETSTNLQEFTKLFKKYL